MLPKKTVKSSSLYETRRARNLLDMQGFDLKCLVIQPQHTPMQRLINNEFNLESHPLNHILELQINSAEKHSNNENSSYAQIQAMETSIDEYLNLNDIFIVDIA